jgi:hypothetical protein
MPGLGRVIATCIDPLLTAKIRVAGSTVSFFGPVHFLERYFSVRFGGFGLNAPFSGRHYCI